MASLCSLKVSRKTALISLLALGIVLIVYRICESDSSAFTVDSVKIESVEIDKVLLEDIPRVGAPVGRHLQAGEREGNEVDDAAVPMVEDIYKPEWWISPERRKCKSEVSCSWSIQLQMENVA